MAEKMTLRESVEIERLGWESYSGRRWCKLAATPSLPMPHVEAQIAAEWDRATAIVDAAVEAHEETVAIERDFENLSALHRRGAAYMKLRALERGEVKP